MTLVILLKDMLKYGGKEGEKRKKKKKKERRDKRKREIGSKKEGKYAYFVLLLYVGPIDHDLTMTLI